MTDDVRVIEDYLPINAISREASREKGVTKGHIRTLHVWWARRPLVACRAAVYGSLVPADRWVKDVSLKGPPDDPAKAEVRAKGTKKGLNRQKAGEFVERLCKYPGDPAVIEDAAAHILEAHAERLSGELAEADEAGEGRPEWTQEFGWPAEKTEVTREDIQAGNAPRPRVLDPFAGGGAIPLEASRLGCDAYAIELNPVAHMVELVTARYAQLFGAPDFEVAGATGPPKSDGTPTWGGLASEVDFWGKYVLAHVRERVGDLYPPIDESLGVRGGTEENQHKEELWGQDDTVEPRQLKPLAYLWARTIPCKKPTCRMVVPLFGQLWLRKKAPRFVYLTIDTNARGGSADISFTVRETGSLPYHDARSGYETSGSATVCPLCQTTIDAEYMRRHARHNNFGNRLMAVVCRNTDEKGKRYLSPIDGSRLSKSEEKAHRIIQELANVLDTSPLDASILPTGNAGYASGENYLHGIHRFRQAFNPRQLATLLTFAKCVREAMDEIDRRGINGDRREALVACLALLLTQCTNRYCALTRWNNVAESVADFSSMKRFALSWDYPEINPWSSGSGNFYSYLQRMSDAIGTASLVGRPADVRRGSATHVGGACPHVDAVITDPPYYDNESYAELSDMYYVWLRVVGKDLFPGHLSAPHTPKKQEVIAAPYRQGGTKEAAQHAYLSAFTQSMEVAYRRLKASGRLVLVYAHKTTVGWGSMIAAIRSAGLGVTGRPLSGEGPPHRIECLLMGIKSPSLSVDPVLLERIPLVVDVRGA